MRGKPNVLKENIISVKRSGSKRGSAWKTSVQGLLRNLKE